MRKITIAIDGHSSCGKSTLAKNIAAKLGYKYIDSGAMYRVVALYCMRNGIVKEGKYKEEEVVNALKDIEVSFRLNPSTGFSDAHMNGENVERTIRTLEVSNVVSKISGIKEVRIAMVALQREMGRGKGVVMDGRDIGSHVFPDAELKIFMTADMDVRAKRRMDELNSKGELVSFDEIKENLAKRDQDDMDRSESPLIKAPKAFELDNSDLNKEQQLNYVLKLVQDYHLLKEKS